MEVPRAGSGKTPDEFRLRPQPDFLSGDVKGTPVDIDRRVRTEPYDQLRNLLWMSWAIESDLSAIPNPIPTQCSSHRQPFCEHLLSPCAPAGIHCRTWANHITANAESALLAGDTAR